MMAVKRPHSPMPLGGKNKHLRFEEDAESSTASSSRNEITTMSKASDYKYCYLSKFLTWVEDTTFYPVDDDMDIKVEVAVEGACESLVGRSTCAKCVERLNQSTIVRLVGAIDWKDILTIDLEPIDERLYPLATSARGALMNGFSNGQAKYFLFELTSLVRPLLCPKHTLQLNISTPLLSKEVSGIEVKVRTSQNIASSTSLDTTDNELTSISDVISDDERKAEDFDVQPSDASSMSSQEEQQPTTEERPKTEEPVHVLKGAPDMTIQVALNPQVFLVVGELKRKMTKVEKIILKGWRPSGAQLISNVLRRNSQIGQLLYYLTAVQLKQIQHALSPEQRICRPQNTCKTLGLFIEGGKITHVVAQALNTVAGNWVIRLVLGEELEFSGSGLSSTMKIVHEYISVDY